MNRLSKWRSMAYWWWRNKHPLSWGKGGVTISAVTEGENPLVDVAIPESESAETLAVAAVTEQGVVGSADEHTAGESSLIVSAADIAGESVTDESAGESIEDEPVAGESLDGVAVPAVESVEAIVRRVLTQTYGRYWSIDDTETLNRVVEILADDAPETAGRVRAVLWRRNANGGPSAAATCNIFSALGRTDELGWVAREAYLYAIGL